MIVSFQPRLSVVVKKLREPFDVEFVHGDCRYFTRHHIGIPYSEMYHWTTTGILLGDAEVFLPILGITFVLVRQ